MRTKTNNKDINKILSSATKRGWKVVGGTKHIKIQYLNGKTITVSSTPRGTYGPNNIKREIEDVEKRYQG